MASGNIKTKQPHVLVLTGTSSEFDQPWAVIKRLFSTFPTGLLIGTINCAGIRSFFGYKFSNDYGHFIVDHYSTGVAVYRVIVSRGATSYAPIQNGSFITVS